MQKGWSDSIGRVGPAGRAGRCKLYAVGWADIYIRLSGHNGHECAE